MEEGIVRWNAVKIVLAFSYCWLPKLKSALQLQILQKKILQLKQNESNVFKIKETVAN